MNEQLIFSQGSVNKLLKMVENVSLKQKYWSEISLKIWAENAENVGINEFLGGGWEEERVTRQKKKKKNRKERKKQARIETPAKK